MPATYEPIATTTLGSAASSITFSSIASTWTDLRVVFVGTSSTANACRIQFNSDTATNYSYTDLIGDGASATSSRSSNTTYITMTPASALSTTISSLLTMDIFSYAGSTYKTALINASEDRNGSGGVGNQVGLWRSTSAINSILIYASSGNFATGTTATIYGIKAA